MSRRSQAVLWFAVVVGGALCQTRCWAQGLPPQPAPVLVAPPPPAPSPGTGPDSAWPPQTFLSIAPPAPPTLRGDWFADAELAALAPILRFDSTIGGTAPMDWTLSPRVLLGYSFDQGGAVVLAYRNLTSRGTSEAPLSLPGGPPGAIETDHTFLDVHWLDLDYISRPYALGEHWWLRWDLGGRGVYRFMKLRADAFVGEFTDSMGFWGGGPHGGADMAYEFADTGLALFSHLDAAVVFGSDRAHLSGSLLGTDPLSGSPTMLHIDDHGRRSETEVDLNWQAGLSWMHWFSHSWLRVTTGVQVEGWGFSGKSNPIDFPFRSLGTAGPFLRGEIGF